MPRLCRPSVCQRAGAAGIVPFRNYSLRHHKHLFTLAQSARQLSSLSSRHRSILLAPTGSQSPSFASTHAFRSFDPSHQNSVQRPDASAHTAVRAASNNDEKRNDGNDSTEPHTSSAAERASAAAVSHPYSARAYRARLQHGNFSSLRELTRAAYAPSPLTVLIDLLRLSVVCPAAVYHNQSNTSSTLTNASVRNALDRALDVQWVLNATVAEARDTVLAAETVGDVASHAALQELLNQIGVFANVIEGCVHGAPSTASAVGDTLQPTGDVHTAPPSHLREDVQVQQRQQQSGSHHTVTAGAVAFPSQWVLPTATHVTLLRGVLQLAAITGTHLHALTALDELITLHERRQRELVHHQHSCNDRQHSDVQIADGEHDDEKSFSMDDALALVDAAAQHHVQPLAAQDHLYAMQACASEHHRDFRTALSLYRRFVQHATAGRFVATPQDFAGALVALAHSSRTTTDFTELRTLLVESEAAATVPVSVPLYTALIDAASRAVEEPQRMAIALSLYRRLRDGALRPTAETYAALIACCASTREPTHAFAFYHEARLVCGVASFPPRVYTNLLLSYAASGYGADARKTLDVLVEAGAPLSRASFHAALASAVTMREALEMVELMTDRYHIAPTPHTYAYVVQALAREPAGVTTALQLFDVHEDVLCALARISASAAHGSVHGGAYAKRNSNDPDVEKNSLSALSTSADGVALEPLLLENYPLYVSSLEFALMRLRVDPTQDPRLKVYLNPLVRVAQQRMNAFTGMPPQSPIRVPDKERLCIAVLAADVLANLDEWVMPFVSHYSVLVIPYSALLSLQKGGGRRVEGAMAKGATAGLHDPVWQETAGGSEHNALVEHRRRRLVKFLADHRNVVHLVSLEEELRWSRETRRYGVGITDLFARAAAVTLHLARRTNDENTSLFRRCGNRSSSSADTSSVYARHPTATIVLVSANYEKCGKYVVALKQAKGKEGSPGLQAALQRVSYHNPRTNPNWVPPSLSITQQQRRVKETRKEDLETPNRKAKKADSTGDAAVAAEAQAARQTTATTIAAAAVDADAASELYRRLLYTAGSNKHHLAPDDTGVVDEDDDGKRREEQARDNIRMADVASQARSTAPKEEEEMDAALLMSFLNE